MGVEALGEAVLDNQVDIGYTSLEFRREVQSGYKFGNYQQSIGI